MNYANDTEIFPRTKLVCPQVAQDDSTVLLSWGDREDELRGDEGQTLW